VNKSRLVLTGANGQLGKTIQKLWAQAPISDTFELLALDRQQLDIADSVSIQHALNDTEVDVIINAAANTAVDGAEENEGNKCQAFAVNEQGPKNLALWAKSNGSRLIQLSTDFVFDGTASSPYKTDDSPNPLGNYGASKLAGERAVAEILPGNSIVLRTSWLYSQYNDNFLKTMLRLMAERECLDVVSDQTGSPTSTGSVSQLIFKIVASGKEYGIYHWSDLAVISWYEFARAIQEEALAAGLIRHSIPINPISTDQYPTLATRPAFSVLDCSNTEADFACVRTPWREQLKLVIRELAQQE
jgi:dTDP-4-dehydrorhamnose reductase